MSKQGRVKVRLLFVDEGSYHHEEVEIPAEALDGYARLIDCVREDEAVQKRLYVDVERLCSAWVVEE
ncbi:MAG: hypothetical protein ACYC6F_16260 [Longimicrobiales bacterium]